MTPDYTLTHKTRLLKPATNATKRNQISVTKYINKYMQTMLRYIKKKTKQNKHIQNKIQRLTKQKQSIAPRVKQTKNKLNRKVIKEKRIIR